LKARENETITGSCNLTSQQPVSVCFSSKEIYNKSKEVTN